MCNNDSGLLNNLPIIFTGLVLNSTASKDPLFSWQESESSLGRIPNLKIHFPDGQSDGEAAILRPK